MNKKLMIVGLVMQAMLGMAEAKEINMLFMGNSYRRRPMMP